MPDNTLAEWLLTCVSDEGSSLRDIISYVDYRNHAILTYNEFTAALKQLQHKGTLEWHGNKLRFVKRDLPRLEIPLVTKDEFDHAVNEYLSKSQ